MSVDFPKQADEGKVVKYRKVESRKWQAELDSGKQSRARLGFILMCTETFMEAELHWMGAMAKGVGVHITRLAADDVITTETLLQHIDGMAAAASSIRPEAGSPDTICYCCTAGSIVMGEDNVMAEIKKGAPSAQPLTLLTGVVDALHELNVHKLVIGTPYLDEINATEEEVFTKKGFEVLDIQGLNLETGTDMGRITPAYLKWFALQIDTPEADAIFLSCGAIRSLEVISEIEAAAGKPVVTSSQAQMWSSLRRAGIRDEIKGLGQLFLRAGAALGPIDAKGTVDCSIRK